MLKDVRTGLRMFYERLGRSAGFMSHERHNRAVAAGSSVSVLPIRRNARRRHLRTVWPLMRPGSPIDQRERIEMGILSSGSFRSPPESC